MVRVIAAWLLLVNLGCHHSVQGGIAGPIPTHPSPSHFPSQAQAAEKKPETSATTTPQETKPEVAEKKYKSIHYSFDENDNRPLSDFKKSAISEAATQWNLDIGHEVFSPNGGRIRLLILFLDTKGNMGDNGGVVVASTYRISCNIQRIDFHKNASLRRNVILHELGHSLGLGHSDNIGDIMYYRVTEQRYPSVNDIKKAKLVVNMDCD